jgi:hypothetical protein
VRKIHLDCNVGLQWSYQRNDGRPIQTQADITFPDLTASNEKRQRKISQPVLAAKGGSHVDSAPKIRSLHDCSRVRGGGRWRSNREGQAPRGQ